MSDFEFSQDCTFLAEANAKKKTSFSRENHFPEVSVQPIYANRATMVSSEVIQKATHQHEP